MTASDAVVALFAACNTLRLVAYLSQILRVARDERGASAISYAAWGLFGLSHLSTVAYAVVVAEDLRMAAIFAANTACCLAVIVLTAWKRRLYDARRDEAGAALAPHVPTRDARRIIFLREPCETSRKEA